MKTQNNMTSLISQAEWWVKKTQTNQVRGTFNWELFMKLIEAKRNENKKNWYSIHFDCNFLIDLFNFVKVIDELVNNRIYKQITKNVCHNHYLWEDLHFESVLIIIEKKFDLTEIRNLKHFYSAVCWRTWHSNKFKKKILYWFYSICR